MAIPLRIPKDQKLKLMDTANGKGPDLKYPTPKILLMDLTDEVREVLASQGYNVEVGSFGTPYRVEQSDSLHPVIPNAHLPKTFEQEIVAVDLAVREPLPCPSGKKLVSEGEVDWWASCSQGIIDPRPRTMLETCSQFDRILAHGGVFVIFTSTRREYEFLLGRVDRAYGRQPSGEKMAFDNWAFLSTLTDEHVQVVPDTGQEIIAVESNGLSDVLMKHGDGAHFDCTLARRYKINEKKWIVLAQSKYHDAVSVLIWADNGDGTKPGWILLLHQVRDKAALLLDILADTLPLLASHLFPYADKNAWITCPDYELPEVLECRNHIETIKRDAAREVETVETRIDEIRRKNRYLYDLLAETDDALVQAVIEGLKTLGFNNVVDVDRMIEESGEDASLREDIQIKDSSPALIIDVKGITGRPSDAEATQAHRHAVMRMKEWKTTEVNALSIINHQRHLPPLERDNDMPFRQEILDGASQIDLGLMTTWDLHRLIRSLIRNKWKPENVKPLFYQRGRIGAVPLQYHYLGNVKQVWKKAGAVSIQLQGQGLRRGDRIGFEMPAEFVEQTVESLRLDNSDVVEAVIGAEVGIATPSVESIRIGMRVYLVRE